MMDSCREENVADEILPKEEKYMKNTPFTHELHPIC